MDKDQFEEIKEHAYILNRHLPKSMIDKELLKIEIIKDPTDQFWNRRYCEVRTWNWAMILSHISFQTTALLNPKTPEQYTVNIWYSVNTAIMIVL